MKSILYVGATLMIGASIYGFVDYKRTSHRKEFSKMYTDKEVKTPLADAEKKEPVKEVSMITKDEADTKKAILTKTETQGLKFKKGKKKKLDYKLFSRAPLEEKYIDKELSKGFPSEKLEPKKTLHVDPSGKNKEQ